MLRTGMTRLEAAQMWVNGFNALPTQMIAKLMEADPDDWCEVTRPVVGDRVYIVEDGEGVVIEVFRKTNLRVKMDNGLIWRGYAGLMEVEYDSRLPMWGTMWSLSNSCDNYWLDRPKIDGTDGITLMSQCGFRIYKSYEFGYFFGIDGAGYDFYESHWLPLYKERGLKWHASETDNEVMKS